MTNAPSRRVCQFPGGQVLGPVHQQRQHVLHSYFFHVCYIDCRVAAYCDEVSEFPLLKAIDLIGQSEEVRSIHGDLAAGTKLGDYDVVEMIGAAGMGEPFTSRITTM
jgi:hypothetical protein